MASVVPVVAPGAERTWTVLAQDYSTVGPVEDWLEAHRSDWSPNTVRAYAIGLAQWWSFLEHRGECWSEVGPTTFGAFLAWQRTGRRADAAIHDGRALSPATLESRLAALLSFYQWQEAIHDVPVASKLLRGLPRVGRNGRGLLAHLDIRTSPRPTSVVRVRRSRRERTPILLPSEVQAILDGCASYDKERGEWVGNLRDRLFFSLLAETGARLGEALGMRISDFVMGKGATPYVAIEPREGNPNGARVKMMRPRRVYVSADLERLYAEYLTHLARRAFEEGYALDDSEFLFVNLDREPLFSPMRDTTVRPRSPHSSDVGSAQSTGRPTGSATATRAPFYSRGRPSGSSRADSATRMCRRHLKFPQSTGHLSSHS